MKKHIALLLAVLMMCVPVLAGCGNSGSDTDQTTTDQVQEEATETVEDTEAAITQEYLTEGGVFTKDTRSCLDILDNRMEGVSAFHYVQENPALYVRWTEDEDTATVVSFNKSDGQTPIDSFDEIPGGVFIGTFQPAGEISEYAINAIVYVLQALNSDLASDNSLYDAVNGMASEVEAMKENIGEGGMSQSTIGDFDVTMLTQDNDNGMTVMFVIKQK